MAITTVLTIDDLRTTTGTTGSTVIVTDVNRGGVFNYVDPTLPLLTTTNPTNVYFSTTGGTPHGLIPGDSVQFSGTLPPGFNFSVGTTYYVVSDFWTTSQFALSSILNGGYMAPNTTATSINAYKVYNDDYGVVLMIGSSTNCWIRQYDVAEGVNVMWFGLAGDGITDDSEAFQNAYNAKYHTYNFPVRDFVMGNIYLNRPNVCLRSESAIYRTPTPPAGVAPNKGTRIFLHQRDSMDNRGGVIFYTTADITGSRFYGLQLNGTLVTSGNSRGMIIGRDDTLVSYPVQPYPNYLTTTNHPVIKCSFQFMQFIGFQQEGWLGENSGSMIIDSCFSTNCLQDITYLTTYRSALAVYGDDCVIDRCEFGALPVNTKTYGAISTGRFSIAAITKASAAIITTLLPHGFAVGDTVTVFDVTDMTQINGLSAPVTATSTYTLTIQLDSSSFTVYNSGGGTVSKGYGTAAIDYVSKSTTAAVGTISTNGFLQNDVVEFSNLSTASNMSGMNKQSANINSALTPTLFQTDFDTSSYTSYVGPSGIVSKRASTGIIHAFTTTNPATVTTLSPHGLQNGNIIAFYNMGGMTAGVNNRQIAVIEGVTSASPTTFTVNLPTAPAGVYITNSGIFAANPPIIIQNITNYSNAGIVTDYIYNNSLSIGNVITIANIDPSWPAAFNGQSFCITAIGAIVTTDLDNTSTSPPYVSGGVLTDNQSVPFSGNILHISPDANAKVTVMFAPGTGGTFLPGTDTVTFSSILPTLCPINGVTKNVLSVMSVFFINLDTTGYGAYTGPAGIISGQIAACGIGLFGGTRRGASWISNSYGELCDCGIYIGQFGVKVTAGRPDHNAGLGFIIDAPRCQIANSTSFDNGLAATGSYDGFLLTTNATNAELSNNISNSDGSVKTRYGFNDLTAQSTGTLRAIFSNCISINDTSGPFNYQAASSRPNSRNTDNGAEIAFNVGATTPDVTNWGMWVTNNSTATSIVVITNFLNGFPGQVIYVRINDNLTTIQNNGNIKNKHNLDISGATGVYQYKYHNGVWYQVVSDFTGTLFAQTAPNGISATTVTPTATSLLGTAFSGIGSVLLPTNFFFVGRVVRLKISGVITTTVSSTLTIKILCGNLLGQINTGTLSAGLSNVRFNLEATITCIATGPLPAPPTPGGLVYIDGGLMLTTSPSTGAVVNFPIINLQTTAGINTKSNHTFDTTASWSVTGNTLTSTIAFLEIVS